MKEFSELQNIDFALGTFISGAFVGLKSDVGPKAYQAFLDRPPNKQIYRHDAESPRDFLIALQRAKRNEQVDGDIRINLPDLPAIFYYRKPGITNAEDRDFIKLDTVWDDAGEKPFELTAMPITLTYTLTILAWDKPTLDKLQLAWYFYISRPTSRFEIKYRVGDDVLDGFFAKIRDHRSLLFTDRSAPREEGRLYAVDTDLEVSTHVIFGEGIVLGDEVSIVGDFAGFCHDWALSEE